MSSDAGATVLTAILPDATGLGRVVRGKGDRVRQIVEHRDATPEQLEIHEINTSVYVFKRSLLAPALRRSSPENSQGEYYLTDVIEVLYDVGYNVVSHVVPDPAEADGVNDRVQLARAETELRSRTNVKLMRAGVSLVDPVNTYIDATVTIGPDTTVYPGSRDSRQHGHRGQIVKSDRTAGWSIALSVTVRRFSFRRLGERRLEAIVK